MSEDAGEFVLRGREAVSAALVGIRATLDANPQAVVSVGLLKGVVASLEAALVALVVHLGGEEQPEAPEAEEEAPAASSPPVRPSRSA